MAHSHNADIFPVALANRSEGEFNFFIVVGQVGNEAGGLVLAQAAAIFSQVDRVEGRPLLVPKLSEFTLEEVVVPPVHVQHDSFTFQPPPAPRPITHESGTAWAFCIISERDFSSEIIRPQNVGPPGNGRWRHSG